MTLNRITRATLITGLGIMTLGGGTAFAIERTDNSGTTTEEHSTITDQKTSAETQNKEREGRSNKLPEDKLSVCRKREGNINKIMGRIAERGEKHIANI